MASEKISCPDCGGSGEIEYDGIVGYVTIDMAIDAGDRSMAGEPVIGKLKEECQTCNGFGYFNPPVEEKESVSE